MNSLQEVNDTLVQAKTTKANLVKSEEDFDIENTKYNLMVKQFEIGDSSKLEELRADINLQIARQRYLSARINDAIATISLYNATGGINYTDERL